MLLATARTAADAWVGSVEADRETAVGLLRRGRALAIGFHGDSFPASVPEGRLARLHLVRREVGLVSSRGRPPRIEDVPARRLASRPTSAGVRSTLDRALASMGADPVAVHQGARVCASHLEVVCAVAREAAEVGVATHAWAHRLGLAFTPLDVEDYGILFFADHLGRPEATRLCEVAQGEVLRSRLKAEAGYDVRDTGAIRFDREPGWPASR